MAEADSIGRIDLDLGVNYDNFNKQISNISNNASSIVSSAFSKIGKTLAIAFAGKSLIDFGKSSIELASNLNEVQNVVDVVFGSMATQVDTFTKNALKSFGMSELSAKKYTSTMGAMLQSMGLTSDQVLTMSEILTKLTGDMASFYNLNFEDTFEKIRAGLAGEVEPLRQLGINLSQTNLQYYALQHGIRQNIDDMSQAQQALLRYNYLLDVTKSAQGDFARTSNSWANQMRFLTEQWNIFKQTVGAGLINIFTPVIAIINTVISKLQIAAAYFKAFTELIFGNSSQQTSATSSIANTANQAANSMNNLGNATQAAGNKIKDASKTAQGSLASFDEINTLAENASNNVSNATSGGVGGTASLGNLGNIGNMSLGSIDIDTSKLTSAQDTVKNFKVILDDCKNYVISNFGPAFNMALELAKPAIDGLYNAFEKAFNDIKTLSSPLSNWFNQSVIPLIQQFIITSGTIFADLLNIVTQVFSSIWNAVFPILQTFVTNGLPVLTEFHNGVLQILNTLFDDFKNTFNMIWSSAVTPVLQLISDVITSTLNIIANTWNRYGATYIQNVKDFTNSIFNTINIFWKSFLQPIVTTILNTLKILWDEHLSNLVQQIADLIAVFINAALEIYNKFITPLVNSFIEVFGPEIANSIDNVIKIIGDLLNVVVDIVSGLIKVFKGLIEFIAGAFTGNWRQAWQGVKDIFAGIFDTLYSIVKTPLNYIIDAINVVIQGLNKIKITVPDWVPGLGGKTYGINIATIPHLATGGLIEAPTLAMLGENNKKEAVIPLENTDFLNALASSIGTVMINGIQTLYNMNKNDNIQNANQNQEIVISIDGMRFARVILPYIQKEQQRMGLTHIIRTV
jgi:phage-related protein